MDSRQRPVIGAVVGVLVGLLIVAVLALMVRTWSLTDQTREAQKTNTGTLEASQRTLDRVNDCTQPSGECFKRGQEQTAKAVGDINRVVVLAAACSVGLDQKLGIDERQSQISSCVIDRLAAKQ